MKKRDYYRGIEDPISGTFNLAEEISERSESILTYSVFATVFVYFGLIMVFILMLAFLFNGQFFVALIFLSVFITGIITAWLMQTLREFLRKVSFRHAAIKAMRDGPPMIRIPGGKTRSERFVEYLKENNRAFKTLLRKRPEVLRKDGYVVGRSGNRYHFDTFVILKPSMLYKLIRKGYPGYGLFIREFRTVPRKSDIEQLTKELSDLHSKTKLHPNRVVVIFRARSNYSGVDDDIYEMIVDNDLSLDGKGRKRLNIQLVGELSEGVYEFIPFIPELPNMLP
ncbi:MAG: hypothetical protein ACMUIG_05040 [Thermoplasmatota archaeon]